jgi:S1-C subfamily serine protease
VIEGCPRVSLPDGAELAVVASDPDLDVAVLMAPDRAASWLTLAGDGVRLGQRVHAAGFPYYSIAGTSLNLTSGNVSALAGVDDDRRFFSFTAPVQPGNSGGPLIDARGAVLGLVVARLSEDYIVEATGSLPQNVNYALRERELAAFLRRSGVAATDGGLGRFDMDEGAPDGIEQAVVPILCR